MEGFERELIESPEEMQRKHGLALSGLVGRRLTAAWVVWDVEDDAWFSDAAVVLDFEGKRLELDCFGLASVSVTWDTLNLGTPPNWYGAEDLILEWRAGPIFFLKSRSRCVRRQRDSGIKRRPQAIRFEVGNDEIGGATSSNI
jgi:hypothetical protein